MKRKDYDKMLHNFGKVRAYLKAEVAKDPKTAEILRAAEELIANVDYTKLEPDGPSEEAVEQWEQIAAQCAKPHSCAMPKQIRKAKGENNENKS